MSQKHPDVEAELNALRVQVEALMRAEAQRAAATAEAAPRGAQADVEAPGRDEADRSSPDFQDLIDLLKHEVEDMNPLAVLAIFGLGVLTGRLLGH